MGRGAMGITYKAFDVDLQCPVTLKVINERYLGDKSARLRFLREARAAARRSSRECCFGFPLGRTAELLLRDEFVEGETSKTHHPLRPTQGEAGARNRDAGGHRIGCGAEAETRSPGHQTE